MEEYLAFVDFVGMTIDGKYIYRFDLTTDTDAVWGEFFNIAPAAIIPDIQPDNNALSHSVKAIFPREMTTAKKNYCFSMQDCIDGIIPLVWSEIDDNTLGEGGVPLYFRFGMPYSDIEKLFNKYNIETFDFEEVKKGDESAIDDLINAMDGEEDEL